MIDGPRACRKEEFEETIALINATFRANSDQNIRTDYPLIFNHDRLDNMRVLLVDGQVVAHVPVAPRQVVVGEDRITVGIISPTVTHPDHRHRGYATLCLRDNVRRMQENGWPVSVLWTQHATFPFYHHSGWEAVGNQGWKFTLQPDDEALFADAGFATIPYDANDPAHLDGVIAIHDSEPHRIARTRNEYATLLTLPKVTTLLAMGGETIAGYVCVGTGSNKPGIIEAGGRPQAVETLIGRLLREREQAIQVVTNLTPTVLEDLLQERVPATREPMENAAGIGPQMMRINDLPLLMRQIQGHLQARSAGLSTQFTLHCIDTGQTAALTLDDGHVEVTAEPASEPLRLSERQLVQLIFGAHASHEPVRIADAPTAALLERLFPVYFPIWELDHS